MEEVRHFVPDPNGDAWLVDGFGHLGHVVRGLIGTSSTSRADGFALDTTGREVPVVIPLRGVDPQPLSRLFVYGSLRRGGRYHDLLTTHRPTLLGLGTTPGQLLDLGPYPGLVPSPSHEVVGEVYDLARPLSALSALDALEDFQGYGEEGSMYRRIITDTTLGHAWSYLLLQVERAHDVIEGGEWIP